MRGGGGGHRCSSGTTPTIPGEGVRGGGDTDAAVVPRLLYQVRG